MQGEEWPVLKDKISFWQSFFSIFIYCDFHLCTFVLKILMTSYAPIVYPIGIAYSTAYYSVTYFAVNYGMLNTVRLHASQAKVNGDYNRMNLIMRQGILYSCLVIVIFSTPAFFFIKCSLRLMDLEEDIIDASCYIVLSMGPALFVRSISDSLKPILQVESHTITLGKLISLNLAIFPFYMYLIIWKLEQFKIGYGLSLFIYESITLVGCLLMIKMYTNREFNTFSLPWHYKFGWFLLESWKSTLTVLFSWVAYEGMIIIITLTKDLNQIAAYSILATVPTLLCAVSRGAVTTPKIILNFYLGNRDFKKAFGFVRYSTPLLLVFYVIISSSVYIFIDNLQLALTIDKEIVFWLNKSNIWVFFAGVFAGLSIWTNFIGISIEKKLYCSMMNTLTGTIYRVCQGYYMTIYMGWGVAGLILSESIVKFVQTIACGLSVAFFDGNAFKGVKN